MVRFVFTNPRFVQQKLLLLESTEKIPFKSDYLSSILYLKYYNTIDCNNFLSQAFKQE